jgi:hypothetical protein
MSENLFSIMGSDDFEEAFSEDEYYNKEPNAQLTRVKDYLENIKESCEEANSLGSYSYVKGKIKRVRKNYVKFGNVWGFANLDKSYKVMLLEGLKSMKVDEKPVTVTLGNKSDNYDIKVSW